LWRGFRSGDETRFNYRYTVDTNDRTDTDSVRQSVSFDYIVPLSVNRSVTTTVQYEDIDFDNDLSPDYEFVSGVLRYNASGDDLDINLSAATRSLIAPMISTISRVSSWIRPSPGNSAR